ncbi:glucose-6-phosphate isomerase family protein [Candidatus Stoquefichus massiliensis]|uniref:glucose-6-phosphate isomerase family protein n=1 Tax=Candidatus Stoquefichus massiliensis TaxID=1470350 RepID=UPI00048757D7|nr:glucose-6-phosphate isomerase family protein [Candidatus Stoquefichus massiliensis]
MKLNLGFEIKTTYQPLGFEYGDNTFGPTVEYRKREDISSSLLNPQCLGPDIVYAIAMDVGNVNDRQNIIRRNLLYGVVTYAKGTLGIQPVHSQGHIHAISQSCQMSTCEVYEIWSGEAYIYMQESAHDYPGRCFAVYAKPGDIVIVPPGWAHATVVADTTQNLTFGAWCVRDYGFVYDDVKTHGGMAWQPIIKQQKICFQENHHYLKSHLVIKTAREYKEFHIAKDIPIYQQFVSDPDLFLFVSQPQMVKELWENFIP